MTDRVPGFLSWRDTPAGRVPQIESQLRPMDHFGTWKVRWGIGRSNYLVPPGLYALGSPGPDDPVVVTANFKMSYDLVRRSLHGRNLWLLVLETFGINVWCAAGKGTFGTEELIRRLAKARLAEVVNHYRLLLPLLGAPGVAAHVVAEETGFQIRYAAVRAADLPAYLDHGMTTTAEMRSPSFRLYDRLVLIPVELLQALRIMAPFAALLFLLGWWLEGLPAANSVAIALLGAVAAGTVVVPLLLPWLPSRRFAVKGALVGAAWGILWLIWLGEHLPGLAAAGTTLALTAVSTFYALSFTGSTPYTSRSGVRRELHDTLPSLAAVLLTAVLLWGMAWLT